VLSDVGARKFSSRNKILAVVRSGFLGKCLRSVIF
jgi:hypothetical protein